MSLEVDAGVVSEIEGDASGGDGESDDGEDGHGRTGPGGLDLDLSGTDPGAVSEVKYLYVDVGAAAASKPHKKTWRGKRAGRGGAGHDRRDHDRANRANRGLLPYMAWTSTPVPSPSIQSTPKGILSL
jgi:hypothetical protein